MTVNSRGGMIHYSCICYSLADWFSASALAKMPVTGVQIFFKAQLICRRADTFHLDQWLSSEVWLDAIWPYAFQKPIQRQI